MMEQEGEYGPCLLAVTVAGFGTAPRIALAAARMLGSGLR